MPHPPATAFATSERALLLAVKGVGPTVVRRLEQMGIGSLARLAEADVHDLLAQGAAFTGSSCWKNSPPARAALEAAVAAALRAVHGVSTDAAR